MNTGPTLRTPRSRALGLGSAHHGVGHFIVEHVSAVMLVPLGLWGAWVAIQLAGQGYDAAAYWISKPVNAVLLAALGVDTVLSLSARGDAKLSLFGRLALFLRQVVAELRKVIWPTRKELVTYTIVVIVFVAVMAAIVAVYDYVFTRGVLFIFG